MTHYANTPCDSAGKPWGHRRHLAKAIHKSVKSEETFYKIIALLFERQVSSFGFSGLSSSSDRLSRDASVSSDVGAAEVTVMT